MPDPRWLTRPAACAALDCSNQTLTNLCNAGKVRRRPAKVKGKVIEYDVTNALGWRRNRKPVRLVVVP